MQLNRYLTLHPQLDIAKDLQKIMRNSTTTTEEKFTQKLDDWYEKYKDTLLVQISQTINPTTKKPLIRILK